MTAEGLEHFRKLFVGSAYDQSPKRSRRFVDRENGVTIDILVTGHYPGRGGPGPFAFPDPSDASEEIKQIRVVNFGAVNSAQVGRTALIMTLATSSISFVYMTLTSRLPTVCTRAFAAITSNVWKKSDATTNTMPAKSDHGTPTAMPSEATYKYLDPVALSRLKNLSLAAKLGRRGLLRRPP